MRLTVLFIVIALAIVGALTIAFPVGAQTINGQMRVTCAPVAAIPDFKSVKQTPVLTDSDGDRWTIFEKAGQPRVLGFIHRQDDAELVCIAATDAQGT